MKTENNQILNSPIMGYAHHRIILDDRGKPVDYEFLEVNATFEKLTGLKADDIVGKTVTTAIPGIEKAEFDWISFYGEVALNGREKEFEQYSDPLEKWYRVHVYSTEKLFFTTMFVDITTSKKQAEEMEAFFSVNLDLLCIADLEGNFIKVNEAWSRILGYSTEELNKRNFLEFVHPDDLEATLGAMSNLGKGDDVLEFTNRYKCKDNTYRFIEWRSHPRGNLIYAAARDVTERVMSEKKLSDDKKQIDMFFNQSLHGFFMCMLDEPIEWNEGIDKKKMIEYVLDHQKMTRVNQAMLDQYGAQENDFAGITVRELFKHDLNHAREIWTGLFDKGKWHVKTYEQKFDGTPILIEGDYICMYDEEGRITGHFGVQVDITEQNKMEKALQINQQRLSRAQTFAHAGTWEYDLKSERLYWSPECEALFGLDEGSFKGNFEDFVSFIHADDREYVAEVNKPITDLKEGKTLEYEHRIITQTGDVLWVRESAGVIRDSEGNPEKIVGFILDITAIKQAELESSEAKKQYQSLVDNIPGIIYRCKFDKDWTMVFMSDAVADVSGYPAEEFLNNAVRSYESVIHPGDRKYVEENINAAIEEKKHWDIEYRIMHKSGETRWVQERGNGITDESGAVAWLDGFILDISERKRADEALLIAKQEAEAASKAKSEFLSNMSHEIRTPLNGVIGFTDLLKNTPLSPLQQQYVNNANVSGHTLLGIINDILDFSKIEAGMLHLEMIKTDIFELLENSVDIVKYQAGQKNLELLLHIDQSMPRFAVTDPIRLKQILANLLGNAVKFTEKGEVELKINYEALENNKGKLSFFVRDTGIGITEEQKSKLFKAFSQADSSTTRKFGGTGLGLIISDLIAKKMGGKILVDSKQGEGTTFYFEIVTEVEDGNRLEGGSLEMVKRCLIIDDNANNRLILQEMLVSWGVQSESCDNGLTALKLLETSKPFDVIICDYNMPYIDGLETIRMIRNKLKLSAEKQPVILLHSSSDDAELQKQCDELDVRFRLTKPVKSHDLRAFLCQVHASDNPREEAVVVTAPALQAVLTGSVNILIAEDVEMNMMMIKALITNIYPKAILHEAVNGLEAVKLMSEVAPDLVLMDVQMPEIDGIEATKKIRILEKESGTHVPIIALTAGAFKEEEEKCLSAGMDDFLTKPIEPEKVQSILLKYCASKDNSSKELTQDSALFCRNTILERVDEDLVKKLMKIALEDFPKKMEQMHDAVHEGNTTDIRAIAHQFKGAASNLCCTLLADIAGAMEQMALTDGNLSLLKDKYKELQDEWEIVKNILEK